MDFVSVSGHMTEADLSRLARMVMTLFDHWQLSSEDRASLLGLGAVNRAALARYRKSAWICTTRDQYERVGHLLAIHASLRVLFPHDRDMAYSWMKLPNCAFNDMTPAEMIRAYGFTGLLMVRTYLERAQR